MIGEGQEDQEKIESEQEVSRIRRVLQGVVLEIRMMGMQEKFHLKTQKLTSKL